MGKEENNDLIGGSWEDAEDLCNEISDYLIGRGFSSQMAILSCLLVAFVQMESWGSPESEMSDVIAQARCRAIDGLLNQGK